MSENHSLPARANLEHLGKQAKQFQKRGEAATLSLAQLAIARRYGFASWQKMKAHVESADKPVNLPHAFRDLMKAIVKRDDKTVADIVTTAPAVVNRTGPHPQWGGRPQPLHVAIETGNQSAFDRLLKSGADVDGDNRSYDRWSPLMLAVHWKRTEMIDELIRRGAEVDLTAALMLKDDRRAKLLLKKPGSVTGPFANDATPLHFARTVGSARLLIRLGADPKAKDKYGKTAAERWVAGKSITPAMLRLAESLGNDTKPDLFSAVEQGKLVIVRKMLKSGADVNARHPGGSRGTLLHTAAWNGDLPMVKLLVSRGADVAALDLEHRVTAVQFARHALKTFDRLSCRAVVEYLDGIAINRAGEKAGASTSAGQRQ